MTIKEGKLRVVGYLVLTALFFIFFMLEMFFSWRDEHMFYKVLLLTVLHTLAIWEPTRFIILRLRHKYAGLQGVKKRLTCLVAIALPYAVLVGWLRIYLEDQSNLWGVSVANLTSYLYTIGITVLFTFLQIAVYESIYFFEEWNRSRAEAEDMKRLNVQIQMDSLKVQIQPHFLFNTLNTLIGLIEVNKDRAISFTENLAFVYRYLLEANSSSLISLEEELRFANTYFSLLKTRYPDGLFLANELPDTEGYEVPPLSLQLLIENAVKHNSITRAKPLFIHLKFDAVGQRLIVENNLQVKNTPGTTGVGLQHLKKKFELLNLPAIYVVTDRERFSVSLPLAKKQQYESINYRR